MGVMKLLPVLVVVAAFGGAAAAQVAIPESTPDGLQRRTVDGVDIAYVRPGADLSGYDRVLIGPVVINFRKGFENAGPGGRARVDDADLRGIRERLGALLKEEVARELQAGGYEIARAAGADVMQLDMRVNDLYVSAPPQPTGGDEVMAFSTGQMLLVADVSDSASGETAARIYQRADGRETHHMRRIAPGENERDARALVARWARTIRIKLDAARAHGPAD